MKSEAESRLPSSSTVHFLLTRFNLQCFSVPPPGDPAYLLWRFGLFEKFTLPSVASQTCTDFRFLVLFDKNTPPQYLQRMETLRGRFRNLHCVLVDGDDIGAAVKPLIPAGTEWIISTRLDNDDAISTDFMERTRALAQPRHMSFVNICRGLVHDTRTGEWTSRTYLYNPFASVTEKAEEFRGIYAYWHSQLHEYGPVAYDFGPPGFLQTINGTNVMNRVQGVPLRSLVAVQGFELAATQTNNKTSGFWPALFARVAEEIFFLKQLYHLCDGSEKGNFKRCATQWLKSVFLTN